MMGKITLKPNTQNILKNYAFVINKKIKIFCPHCFRLQREGSMRKHFGNCAFIIKGDSVFEMKNIRIIKCNDARLKSLIKRFNKFIFEDGGEIRRINWSKKYDYWIFQADSKRWGRLPVGLAMVRYSLKMNCHVLSAMIIFPRISRRRRLGTRFIEELVKYYKDDMGLMIESPNSITKKICDNFGLEYYDAP